MSLLTEVSSGMTSHWRGLLNTVCVCVFVKKIEPMKSSGKHFGQNLLKLGGLGLTAEICF